MDRTMGGCSSPIPFLSIAAATPFMLFPAPTPLPLCRLHLPLTLAPVDVHGDRRAGRDRAVCQ